MIIYNLDQIYMSLCIFKKYSDILGIPNKGVHQYRFLNTAIVDYLLTIVLSMFTTYKTHIPLTLTTIFLFVSGIFLHMIFGVQTSALSYLGIEC